MSLPIFRYSNNSIAKFFYVVAGAVALGAFSAVFSEIQADHKHRHNTSPNNIPAIEKPRKPYQKNRRVDYNRSRPLLSSYLGLGLGFGGDEVGRFLDSYGDTDTIRSGGGFLFEAGLNLSVDNFTDLRLTGGYQVDGTSRGNGGSLFDRLRFDLTMLRRMGSQEIGAGLTAHTSVGYRCHIDSICEGDVEFNHAMGYTLEYAVHSRASYSSSGMRLGLRYTGITYTPRAVGAELLSGNSVTGFIGVVF